MVELVRNGTADQQ